MLNDLELTGCACTHIVQIEQPHAALHRDAAGPFLAMRKAAVAEGIDLRVSSGFRDFPSQCTIWRRKFLGERPLLDAAGVPVDRAALDDDAVISLILRWSALPGASRHHWGSELDLYDAAAMPSGYRVQLVPDEYAPGGVFSAASKWLETHAAGFGFFRPYRDDLGGVLPEPWHWSYAPVSVPASRALTPTLVAAALGAVELPGLATLQGRLEALFGSHVLAVAPPPPELAARLA